MDVASPRDVPWSLQTRAWEESDRLGPTSQTPAERTP
jgi:hypothetical protein